MGGKRHQIHFHCLQINRLLAGTLGCIHMKKHSPVTTDLTDSNNIVNRANLIIDMH